MENEVVLTLRDKFQHPIDLITVRDVKIENGTYADKESKQRVQDELEYIFGYNHLCMTVTVTKKNSTFTEMYYRTKQK